MDTTSKTIACTQALSGLKQEFAQWRAGRKGGERIPVALWAQASQAAAAHGAYRVSVELHLDYVISSVAWHGMAARRGPPRWHRDLSNCSHQTGRCHRRKPRNRCNRRQRRLHRA